MKSAFWMKLFAYVLIRVLLLSATICLFIFGISQMIADPALVIILSILFVAGMCLFTAVIVVRHSIEFVTIMLSKVLESANTLRAASMVISKAAKSVLYATEHSECLSKSTADVIPKGESSSESSTSN